MKTIHFIVNPIAGKGKSIITEYFLSNFFEKEFFQIRVKYSNYKGHAKILTQQSINEKAEIIVACGGDGTINEVASCLVNSKITLGIIPIGSGNGLAQNLKIPKKIKTAILQLKNQKVTTIDVGSINGKYFFSNTGFGFTASVIRNYENLNQRTLFCYLKASYKSFKECNEIKENITIINGTSEIINPFLIFISNSNVMGYNFSLTPKASLQDGLLDVIIVPKISKLKMLFFGFFMLIKKPYLLKGVECFQTNEISLSRKPYDFLKFQMDGELAEIEEQLLTVSLKEKSLSVITC
jgi:diacylglycerol kinase (ATP)